MKIQFPAKAEHRLLELTEKTSCCFIADAHIARIYKLPSSLRPLLLVHGSEACKSMKTVTTIIDFLLTNTATASSRVIAIGGGAVCDTVGFTASIFKRGIPTIYVPTTLLAQVDAAYGGKTAVNYRGIKNLVGTFSQPEAVVADSAFLLTLSYREYHSGLGEIIKYAIGFDKELFSILENNCHEILRRDTALLSTITSRCMTIKQKITEHDPTEKGERRLLNLGHTFGHIFESSLHISHGHAVVLGVLAAVKISKKLNILHNRESARIQALIEKLGFKASIPPYSKHYGHYLRQDKKSNGKVIHFIIPETLGKAKTVELDQASLLSMVYEI